MLELLEHQPMLGKPTRLRSVGDVRVAAGGGADQGLSIIFALTGMLGPRAGYGVPVGRLTLPGLEIPAGQRRPRRSATWCSSHAISSAGLVGWSAIGIR